MPLGDDIDRVSRVVEQSGGHDGAAWLVRWTEGLAKAVDERDQRACADRHIELLLFERALLTPPARAAELEDLVTGLGFDANQLQI